MTWTIIIFPVQVFILLIPALLINALLLFLGWYIWHYMSQPHIPYATHKHCCVCGQKGAYVVQYVSSDEAQALVTDQFCSACLGQLLSPVD